MSSVFPDPNTADSTGLVSVTQTMTPEMLLDAYSNGIFPWSENPVAWYSPDPRAVFLPDWIQLPSNLPKILRKRGFRYTCDEAFDEVMKSCVAAHKDDGTWISAGFLRCYGELHRRGVAHSIEVWRDDELVGGLYGMYMGGMFAGESMFHRASDAGKAAFAALLCVLDQVGYVFIDAQVLNENTHRLGAMNVSRSDFLMLLNLAQQAPTRDGAVWPSSLLDPLNRFS